MLVTDRTESSRYPERSVCHLGCHDHAKTAKYLVRRAPRWEQWYQ
jgi:hypothetical protein